jgi:hypothetical protein
LFDVAEGVNSFDENTTFLVVGEARLVLLVLCCCWRAREQEKKRKERERERGKTCSVN